MFGHADILFNTPHVEVWPARLLHARSNRDARLLARADLVLRRKRDGRFLAVVSGNAMTPLRRASLDEPGLQTALSTATDAWLHRQSGVDCVRALPLQRLGERLRKIGLDAHYGERTGLHLVPEPDWLAFAGLDRYRRPLWLHRDAARAWMRMRAAALRDGVAIEAISGYRSHDYQLGIFARKFARGQTLQDILAVNAAPGFSEHHSGRALDIGTPGEPAAEESFERTSAFAWLREHAGRFGFTMSYPRDNPHGIVYEPWHWCWNPASAEAVSITPASA